MSRSTTRAVRKYCAERDAVLRSLDEDAFIAHCNKWKVPQPARWLPGAIMILMHKSRLQIASFTEEEKRTSREWLTAHRYDLSINHDGSGVLQ